MAKEKDLVEQARQLRLQAEALEKAARLARGTQGPTRAWPAPSGWPAVPPARGPYWVGDEGTTEELMAVMQKMLVVRPWRFVELLEATGARDNRIKGVLMRLQREGVRVVDVSPGGTHKALWFIPSDAVLVRLQRVAARAKGATKRGA